MGDEEEVFKMSECAEIQLWAAINFLMIGELRLKLKFYKDTAADRTESAYKVKYSI